MAEQLELPRPFDPVVLLEQLAVRRGRPIELLPVPARPHAPCGLLVSTVEADYILYAADTGVLHQRHILVHEIAHLLLDHAGSAPLAPAAALLPNLSPALVQRVLGRTSYDEPQEREAELLASLILSRAERADAADQSGTGPTPAGGSLDALGVLLAARRHGGPARQPDPAREAEPARESDGGPGTDGPGDDTPQDRRPQGRRP
ncbi:ParH-like protein [Kitasatospora sp. NPDC059146]|uniref:ParH-like protein n=1 Tax=Kitasatospora sp. NPDC059146 TaxID=3346741 RepID=UPI00368D79EA